MDEKQLYRVIGDFEVTLVTDVMASSKEEAMELAKARRGPRMIKDFHKTSEWGANFSPTGSYFGTIVKPIDAWKLCTCSACGANEAVFSSHSPGEEVCERCNYMDTLD